MCVAQRNGDNMEERVVLFLKMAPGSEFNQDLVNSLKASIRLSLSARHVPAVFLPITDIPVSSFHCTNSLYIYIEENGQDFKGRLS